MTEIVVVTIVCTAIAAYMEIGRYLVAYKRDDYKLVACKEWRYDETQAMAIHDWEVGLKWFWPVSYFMLKSAVKRAYRIEAIKDEINDENNGDPS